MNIKIVGTGHILEKSVEGVREAVFEERPDIVALELCEKRFQVIASQGADFYQWESHESAGSILSEVVRGGSFLVLLGGVLALIQRDLGEKYGIPPGSDMFAASQFSKEVGAEISLIDRDIEVTVSRLVNIPFREILRMLRPSKEDALVFGSLFGTDLSAILEEKNINKIMGVVRKRLPYLYNTLVDERDRYMTLSLHQLQANNPGKRILAIVGAGHKKGILRYVEDIEKGRFFDAGGLTRAQPVSKLRVLALSFIFFLLYILIRVQLWIRR